MITLIVALLSVVLPLMHLGLSRRPRTRGRVVHLLLLYGLVLDVGVIGPVGVHSSYLLPRSGGSAHRLAAGKPVPVGGRVSCMGAPRLPEHLDRRVALARDRARLVVL